MTHDPAARQLGEARAIAAALAIATTVGWRFRHAGPTLSTEFAGYLHVETASLLLVPTSDNLPLARRLVDRAMREARSDALIVSCLTQAGKPHLLFALGLWAGGKTWWQLPVSPWLDRGERLWLEPADRCVEASAYPLREGRIRADTAPWWSVDEYHAGRAEADAWLAGVIR